jgi:hypothetical protein
VSCCKRIVWKLLAKIKLDAPVLLLRASALTQEGWYQSYHAKQAVDRMNRPIPWYTYPAIHFIEPRLKPSFRVFEYGSGSSTIWYAQRVGEVVAVEHNTEWAAKISVRLPVNALVVSRSLGIEYVDEIGAHGLFDIVAIDGRNRSECAKAALGALKPAGIIIWDDSQRTKYAAGIKTLLECNFREIAFQGMTPIVAYHSQTSILYRTGNCLGI